MKKIILKILILLILAISLFIPISTSATLSWQQAYTTFLANYNPVTRLQADGWSDILTPQDISRVVGNANFTFALAHADTTHIPQLLVSHWNTGTARSWRINIYQYQQGQVVLVASESYFTRPTGAQRDSLGYSDADLSPRNALDWHPLNAATINTHMLGSNSSHPFVTRLQQVTDHTLDIPAQLVNGRTMLPLRAVLESFGYRLYWISIITVSPVDF